MFVVNNGFDLAAFLATLNPVVAAVVGEFQDLIGH